MAQLEFMARTDETLIASCAMRPSDPVPMIGDRTDVYVASQPGTCACLRVASRRFFYDTNGALAKVQLWCDEAT
jgi:hypothetical protein